MGNATGLTLKNLRENAPSGWTGQAFIELH